MISNRLVIGYVTRMNVMSYRVIHVNKCVVENFRHIVYNPHNCQPSTKCREACGACAACTIEMLFKLHFADVISSVFGRLWEKKRVIQVYVTGLTDSVVNADVKMLKREANNTDVLR